MNAGAWSPDGKLIAGGELRAGRELTIACLDGSLHVWRTNSNFARPDKSNEAAHQKGTETTGVVFSPDSTRLVTRGSDETIKREFGPSSDTDG